MVREDFQDPFQFSFPLQIWRRRRCTFDAGTDSRGSCCVHTALSLELMVMNMLVCSVPPPVQARPNGIRCIDSGGR